MCSLNNNTHPLKFFLALTVLYGCSGNTPAVRPASAESVKIVDSFWSPRMEQWSGKTVNYLFDKFEGRDILPGQMYGWPLTDAFANFDRVAAGERDCGEHAGFPWFDGLIYETIRAAADFQYQYPSEEIQQRIDSYVKRIAAAQESDGYINTYTQMVENGHRWGENGGRLRWQHELYNAGALVDAGVHYYNATGKRDLLDVAIKEADLICNYIGWAPKHDIVPGHALPEEAFISLFETTGDRKYLDQTRFWIDARGSRHPGLDCEYAQDRVPVRELTSLEGHAVRATLLMDGVADYCRVSGDTTYFSTCKRLWDNMVGRKMLLTGSVGSIAADEKFGDDYFLPVDAYAETCAGVGLAFYSWQMHLLDRNGKYIDELERALYNNVLGGISLSGTEFTYVNPLNADNVSRWTWNGCPCCPPMFLKLMSALPSMIYSTCGDDVFVNLYIGSVFDYGSSTITVDDSYVRDGKVTVNVDPRKSRRFALNLRCPGWARSCENPFGLYRSDTGTYPVVRVNGVEMKISDAGDGYFRIERKWKKGDTVEIAFQMEPRYITAEEKTGLSGKCAIGYGPFIYCVENVDNPDLDEVRFGGAMNLECHPDLFDGIALVKSGNFTAIPYFAMGNRSGRSSYRIWVDCQ